MSDPVRLTPDNICSLLKGIRYVLLDCDGVLWSGDVVFPGILDTVQYLRHTLGLQVRFVTNADLRSRPQLLENGDVLPAPLPPLSRSVCAAAG